MDQRKAFEAWRDSLDWRGHDDYPGLYESWLASHRAALLSVAERLERAAKKYDDDYNKLAGYELLQMARAIREEIGGQG